MRLVRLPGVFAPHSDSWLLAEHARQEVEPGARVADLCTGSGLIAVTAALAGAADVVAVDVSRRAVMTAWLNARLNRAPIRARHGDLLAPLGDERFDLIAANPPYVPAAGDALPVHGPERAWDAGRDGRALLDRICAEAPARLRPGGALLLVHSSICGTDRTAELLAARDLEVEVVARAGGPLGPILRARAAELERRGLIERGAQTEELVVIRGRRPVAADRGGAPATAAAGS